MKLLVSRTSPYLAVLQLLTLATEAATRTSTVSSVRCFTTYGSTSTSRVRTITYTSTNSYTVDKTTKSTVTVTTTPSSVTESDTTTVTEVTTSTSTVVTTPTVTASTSAGFVPIKSAVPNSQKRLKRSDLQDSPEALEKKSDKLLERNFSPNNKIYTNGTHILTAGKKSYPEHVRCLRIVDVIATRTHTATAKTTKTVTTGDAPVFTTFIATTTLSTTSTTTETDMAPASTYYAACQSDNFIHTVNGDPILSFGFVNGEVTTDTTDSLSCCEACNLSQTCASFVYPSDEQSCYLAQTSGTCDATQLDGSPFETADGPAGYGSMLGNSNCGQASYHGSLF